MTKAYEDALNTANAASAVYALAAADYRNMKIGDAEYLAARKVHENAKMAFDIAFEIEANGGSQVELAL